MVLVSGVCLAFEQERGMKTFDGWTLILIAAFTGAFATLAVLGALASAGVVVNIIGWALVFFLATVFVWLVRFVRRASR